MQVDDDAKILAAWKPKKKRAQTLEKFPDFDGKQISWKLTFSSNIFCKEFSFGVNME